MGCAASRESPLAPHHNHHHHHHRTKRHHPSNTYYDWDKEAGGYIPYRYQTQQRRQWRHEDREAKAQKSRDAAERERNRRALVQHYNAGDEKVELVANYRERVGRQRAEAYGQQVRDKAEREGNREAVRCWDVDGEGKGRLRRVREEEGRRVLDEDRRGKAKRGKTEKIRVYATPDLKSRWSE